MFVRSAAVGWSVILEMTSVLTAGLGLTEQNSMPTLKGLISKGLEKEKQPVEF